MAASSGGPTKVPVLVVGSGLAGCMAALAASEQARVLLITKGRFEESASWHAQGGVAAAMAPGDSAHDHAADTLEAGCGLCDFTAVRALTIEGVERCRELVAWGVPFDRAGDGLAYTLEAAHRRARVLHALGDATGRAIVETLRSRLRREPNITLLENHMAVHLLAADGVCHGAWTLDTATGAFFPVLAGATLLATGGLGQALGQTTNPETATGDGCALALRAGARLRDMEFIQFHPTVLFHGEAPRFLITEAARGEGARLVNRAGEPFMRRYHEKGDLAPRDVVSRSIETELRATGADRVWLDFRPMDAHRVRQRFPTVWATCARWGLDLARDPVPVRPAAHYAMGGVSTDLEGRTRVDRLFAAGETACTGAHGANRLASNSLLDCLVFGRRAGYAAARAAAAADPDQFSGKDCFLVPAGASPLEVPSLSTEKLGHVAWRQLGVFRDAEGLNCLEEKLAAPPIPSFFSRRNVELANMFLLVQLIGRMALARNESRGAHQRRDWPHTDPAWTKPSYYESATASP